MPGKKKRFTKTQDRMASHVAASERKRGKSAKDAKSIGYATVNKQKSKRKKETPHQKKARTDSKRRPRNKGRS